MKTSCSLVGILLLSLTACGQMPTAPVSPTAEDGQALPFGTLDSATTVAVATTQAALAGSWRLIETSCGTTHTVATYDEILNFNQNDMTIAGLIYCDNQMHVLQNYTVEYAEGSYTSKLFSALTGTCPNITYTKSPSSQPVTYPVTFQADEMTVTMGSCGAGKTATRTYRKE